MLTPHLAEIIKHVKESYGNITYTMNPTDDDMGLTFSLARVRHPDEKIQRGKAKPHLLEISPGEVITITSTIQKMNDDGDVDVDQVTTECSNNIDKIYQALAEHLHTLVSHEKIVARSRENEKKAKFLDTRQKPAPRQRTETPKKEKVKTVTSVAQEPGMYVTKNGYEEKVNTDRRNDRVLEVGMFIALLNAPSLDSNFSQGHIAEVVEVNPTTVSLKHPHDNDVEVLDASKLDLLYDFNNPQFDLILPQENS